MGFPRQGMIFYENLSTKNNAAAHHTRDIMHSAITFFEEYMVSSLNGTYHILGPFALVCTDGIFEHHVMPATSYNSLNMTVSLNIFNSSVSLSYHNHCVFKPRELWERIFPSVSNFQWVILIKRRKIVKIWDVEDNLAYMLTTSDKGSLQWAYIRTLFLTGIFQINQL